MLKNEGAAMSEFPYYFAWDRPGLEGRKGQPCKVVVKSQRMNSAMIEFPDGKQAVVSRFSFRKRKDVRGPI